MYLCVITGGYMCLYQEFNGIVDNTKIVNKNNCIYESCNGLLLCRCIHIKN